MHELEIARQQMDAAKAQLSAAAEAVLRGEGDEQAVEDARRAVDLAREQLAQCQEAP